MINSQTNFISFNDINLNKKINKVCYKFRTLSPHNVRLDESFEHKLTNIVDS